MDSRLTMNTSWKEVALDAARTFRVAKMDEPLRIIGLSFDKFSQPHDTAPALKIESCRERLAYQRKTEKIPEVKKLENYL